MRARLFSEAFGTFGVVFAGTGAIVINQVSGGAITHPGIALTFGLIVLAMIYTFGDVPQTPSGARSAVEGQRLRDLIERDAGAHRRGERDVEHDHAPRHLADSR